MIELNNFEKDKIYSFAKDFKITNATSILNFGKIVEDRIATLNNTVFNEAKRKDNSEIERIIKEITIELDKINSKPKKVSWFKKLLGEVEEEVKKPNYNLMIDNINALIIELKKHIITLHKDLQLIELLSENSNEYLHELDMYILASELILKKANDEANKKRQERNELEYSDMINAINNFEKRIHDLKLMRTITIQSIPQMNLIRDNNYQIIDRINYIITNTIPLWKGQLLIIMSMENATDTTKSTSKVSEMMNKILLDNSEELIAMTTETKEELKRGTVTSKTLVETTKMIVASLDEINRLNEKTKTTSENVENNGSINNTELEDNVIVENKHGDVLQLTFFVPKMNK